MPTAIALLPGALTIVSAASLSSTATAPSSLLFNWGLDATSTSLALSPSANFTPVSLSLTPSQTSLAGYLNRAWSNADAKFATDFARLTNVTGAQYINILNTLSAKATQAQPTALAASMGSILGAAMSCPVFADQGTLLTEDGCVWARFSGEQTNQFGAGDTLGYNVASTTYRIGGQHTIAPGWFLGGSLAAGQAWATMQGGSSGSGQTFDGSVALKHTAGPWLFAASVALGNGGFQTTRLVSLPWSSSLLKSNQDAVLAGG